MKSLFYLVVSLVLFCAGMTGASSAFVESPGIMFLLFFGFAGVCGILIAQVDRAERAKKQIEELKPKPDWGKLMMESQKAASDRCRYYLGLDLGSAGDCSAVAMLKAAPNGAFTFVESAKIACPNSAVRPLSAMLQDSQKLGTIVALLRDWFVKSHQFATWVPEDPVELAKAVLKSATRAKEALKAKEAELQDLRGKVRYIFPKDGVGSGSFARELTAREVAERDVEVTNLRAQIKAFSSTNADQAKILSECQELTGAICTELPHWIKGMLSNNKLLDKQAQEADANNAKLCRKIVNLDAEIKRLRRALADLRGKLQDPGLAEETRRSIAIALGIPAGSSLLEIKNKINDLRGRVAVPANNPLLDEAVKRANEAESQLKQVRRDLEECERQRKHLMEVARKYDMAHLDALSLGYEDLRAAVAALGQLTMFKKNEVKK